MPKPFIAINSAKVANHPDSFRLFESVGPKVCMVTANHSGFVGFQNHVQIGVFPMGGRYGGAEMDMRQTLNPLGIRQYTMWKRWEDHEEMHVQQFDSIFRLCSSCLGMVIEGPWEPIYEIVSSDLPENMALTDVPATLGSQFMAGQPVPAVSMPYGQRVIAASEHTIIPGMENAFESAIEDLMQMFKKAPGFLGYMVLKQIGASAIGSLQLTPEGIHQALQTLGDYPPRAQAGNFETLQAAPTPREYVVHMEWQDLATAQFGISRVVVNTRYRAQHDKVLKTLIRGPYVTLWSPMMEDTSWREYLHS
ncbi:sulfur oxygenase/reductase [Sulfobacillus thermosulfidooxidans]|uniref:sulfur oxygenase/reductase n=1 Tax=Sulfobacillus thermosulfidooxidans TaxID=28034 RepID=UPI0006B4C77D|nr:sulfur oxygenase reductase family protein [Sulfobacillus thermosulfidooxidans]